MQVVVAVAVVVVVLLLRPRWRALARCDERRLEVGVEEEATQPERHISLAHGVVMAEQVVEWQRRRAAVGAAHSKGVLEGFKAARNVATPRTQHGAQRRVLRANGTLLRLRCCRAGSAEAETTAAAIATPSSSSSAAASTSSSFSSSPPSSSSSVDEGVVV